MPGRRNRRSELVPYIQKGQDVNHIYEAACIEYADEFGWEREFVCYWWSQIALARQKENREPQFIAEDYAFHNVREALDQRGRQPS